MELVSIIIPVYNGQRTILRCLKSILNQTYHNIEIVIVNDGSVDRSRELFEKYLLNVKTKVIINKDKNGGIEKARHTGITVSNGTFITFVDQDDYLDRRAVENMVHALNLYNADLVQCQSDSFITLGRLRINNIFHSSKKRGVIRLIEKEDIIKEMFSFFGCGNFNVCVWSKLYKKELLNDLMLGGLLYTDDLYLNLQVFPKLYRICVLPDILYHYERQGTSSKFLRLWMEESKKLYNIKVAKSKEMNSDNAFLYSTIELRNCFKVYVESMILFKIDSKEAIKQWIIKELKDSTYDVFDWLREQQGFNKSPIAQAIINRNADSIYDLCYKSVYEWKPKKIARRLLTHF